MRSAICAADSSHKFRASPKRKARARTAIYCGMPTTLVGSTALVTGATSGIGRAIAQQLSALGAEVVVHGRSPERGAETVRAIENEGGKARFVAADLSKADEVRRLAERGGPRRHPDKQRGRLPVRRDCRYRRRVLRRARQPEPACALHPGAETRAGHGGAGARCRRQHQHVGGLDAGAPGGHLRGHQGGR